jgi:hypothetical protein
MSGRLRHAPRWRRRRLAIKDGLMSDDRDHTIATATAMVMYADARAGRWPGWMSRRSRLAGTKGQVSGNKRVTAWHRPGQSCATSGLAASGLARRLNRRRA